MASQGGDGRADRRNLVQTLPHAGRDASLFLACDEQAWSADSPFHLLPPLFARFVLLALLRGQATRGFGGFVPLASFHDVGLEVLELGDEDFEVVRLRGSGRKWLVGSVAHAL